MQSVPTIEAQESISEGIGQSIFKNANVSTYTRHVNDIKTKTNAIWERYRQTSITNAFQEGSFQVFKSIFCVLFAYAYVWEVGLGRRGGWCKRISDMWRLLAPLTWEL